MRYLKFLLERIDEWFFTNTGGDIARYEAILREKEASQKQLWGIIGINRVTFSYKAMQHLLKKARKLPPSDPTIFLSYNWYFVSVFFYAAIWYWHFFDSDVKVKKVIPISKSNNPYLHWNREPLGKDFS